MKIKVLGPGCARCNSLYKDTLDVLKTESIEADVEHITDIAELVKYQVLSTPAFIIDEKVVSTGKALSKKDILKFIKENS